MSYPYQQPPSDGYPWAPYLRSPQQQQQQQQQLPSPQLYNHQHQQQSPQTFQVRIPQPTSSAQPFHNQASYGYNSVYQDANYAHYQQHQYQRLQQQPPHSPHRQQRSPVRHVYPQLQPQLSSHPSHPSHPQLPPQLQGQYDIAAQMPPVQSPMALHAQPSPTRSPHVQPAPIPLQRQQLSPLQPSLQPKIRPSPVLSPQISIPPPRSIEANSASPELIVRAPPIVSPQVTVAALQHGGSNAEVPQRPTVHPIKTTATVVPQAPDLPEIDYADLLITLAEESFRSAHKKGNNAARCTQASEPRSYYKLVGFGLACLETVLNKSALQIPPRTEALVRMKFASVLFEETENADVAEAALTKGITLCERNRFADLKYTMQHLLVRIIHATNPRAALKSLDGIVTDVEAYGHRSWAYAFRFLRASLSIEKLSHLEITAALTNLRKISETSSKKGDTAIFVTAAVMETQTHLRSKQPDSIEQAQRSLAMARSLQLDTSITSTIPQVMTLACLLDLACSLQESNVEQSTSRMSHLHSLLDGASKKDGSQWNNGSSFHVPISSSKGQRLNSGKGVGPVTSNAQALDQIEFRWLSKEDAYALSYLLSGAAVSNKNAAAHKAESFFTEGLKLSGQQLSTDASQTPASAAGHQNRWRVMITCFTHVYNALVLCSRSEWTSAKEHSDEAKSLLIAAEPDSSPFIKKLILYLDGVIDQATGHLAKARHKFQQSDFAVQSNTKGAGADPSVDLAILANLNLALMLHGSSESHRVEGLLVDLEPLCVTHPNRSLKAAFSVVKAALQPHNAIVNTKNLLQNALSAAKSLANSQLVSMTLNIMSARFFSGVVGDQAEKMARAGLHTAQQAGNSLWISVAEGMMADALEVMGKTEDAGETRRRAYSLSSQIVPRLQEAKEEGGQGVSLLGNYKRVGV
ncbi:MAG: hypothetical protein M1814_002758 [Vezdaea aestivalis]|nr:MAG: hypothetical protein M1814_002758 [Vezdaea aestivalis]